MYPAVFGRSRVACMLFYGSNRTTPDLHVVDCLPHWVSVEVAFRDRLRFGAMKVGIIGSGNIGTDLAIKVVRSSVLQLLTVAGIDPESDGLRRARELGAHTTHEGIE